jgi:hypothetical protein
MMNSPDWFSPIDLLVEFQYRTAMVECDQISVWASCRNRANDSPTLNRAIILQRMTAQAKRSAGRFVPLAAKADESEEIGPWMDRCLPMKGFKQQHDPRLA